MLLFASLFACQESKIPEDALHFDVQVTAADIDDDGLANTCHPESTEGFQQSFEYIVALEVGADDRIVATVYIGEAAFATGTMVTGCEMEYQSVVMGEETEADGEVRWQLFGTAMFDAGNDGCVEGDGDWVGTEWFEVVSAPDETIEQGCTYEMTTTGSFIPQAE